MDTDQTLIAKTIIAQIGPGSLMRIGAHTMLTTDTGIIIHMGRGHRTKLVIDYRLGSDTYTIKIGKLARDLSYSETTIAEDIYYDQLAGIVADLG